MGIRTGNSTHQSVNHTPTLETGMETVMTFLPVDGNQSNVNLTLNYETDQDNDGFSLWTETQAGSR